ncbi:type IV secretion system DNA-binding domain-containing protein [Rhodococcus sp. IEGM 1374]|uniref:type IV secretory system conjugative DNA transfer family protein n=1 Tax=Rhodococcus sp. IEGM 1374 TaxID=3082221 RepID=UPI0029533A8C|nr:type IV secretion system DNA-binding domain-containing protein [Rhodococcus sp. IEGM 1374]MDV7990496.1 type IV secretion system DNA-binding domain-containing protein [Rhodococcus sp. IEGM 1374]
MLELLAALGILSASSLGALFHMRSKSQKEFDADRVAVSLIFPSGVTEQQVQAAIRSIGSNLRDNKLTGDPSIVFELIATERGITHQLRVPSRDASYLFGQLEVHLPGIEITPIEKLPDASYDYGLQLSLTDPGRTIRVSSAVEYATKIIKSVQTDHPGQRVTLQWIIFNTSKVKGQVTGKSSLTKALIFGVEPNKDELSDRHAKAIEQNYTAVGRIGVRAKTPGEAKALAGEVLRALTSENNENRFRSREIPFRDLDGAINGAHSVQVRQIQFTVSEFSAFMGWPIGDPQIPGLHQGAARRFPATEKIAREGWVFGHSDVGALDRPVALALSQIPRHVALVGGPGTGKTSFMANGVLQVVKAGLGAIVFDAGTDVSMERLYYRVLNSAPSNRIDDFILINPADDREHVASLNLLDQGLGTAVIDIVEDTFTDLYPSIGEGVSFRELLRNGLGTLIEHGGYTLMDLASLISPRNIDEQRWAKELIEGVKDPELKDFWARNPAATDPNAKSASKWDAKVETVLNKLWQIAGQPDVRHLLGQTESTIKLADVLAENKVLLISLGGLPGKSAQLLGNLLTATLWRIAQIQSTQEKPNIMFVDEFQVVAQAQDNLSDMLARGRALKLGLVLGTQFITRPTISRDLQSTVLQNTMTQIVFKADGREAGLWAQQLGKAAVNETDVSKLPQFHGIARIIGESSPVTFTALRPPTPAQGVAERVIQKSRSKYARPVESVRAQIISRRMATSVATNPSNRKPTGKGPYDATKREHHD